MKVNFKKTSWHRRFYDANYGGSPDNLCGYFWKVVVACLFLPLTWFTYIGKTFRKEHFIPRVWLAGVGHFIAFMLLTLGAVLSSQLVFGREEFKLIDFFIGIPVLLVCFALIVVLGGLVVWGCDRFKDREKKTIDKPSGFVSSFVRSKREKVCPKINWIE